MNAVGHKQDCATVRGFKSTGVASRGVKKTSGFGGGGTHAGYKTAVALAERAKSAPAHSTKAMETPLGSG